MIIGENRLLIQKYDLVLEEIPKGLKISQHGKSYIANRWKLTPQVKEIFKTAHKFGFTCHWTKGHPNEKKYEGNSGYQSGIHHITFAPSHHEKWVFVLGGEALPPKVRCITFNKAYREIIKLSEIPYIWETSGGHNILISPYYLSDLLKDHIKKDVIKAVQSTIKLPSTWRSNVPKTGLFKEMHVELALIESIERNIGKAKFLTFVRPCVDGKFPDIIFKKRNELSIVLELKLDAALEATFDQITGYQNLERFKREFGNSVGAIIARNFHPDLVSRIQSSKNLALYRYHWNGKISLEYVAGEKILENSYLNEVLNIT